MQRQADAPVYLMRLLQCRAEMWAEVSSWILKCRQARSHRSQSDWRLPTTATFQVLMGQLLSHEAVRATEPDALQDVFPHESRMLTRKAPSAMEQSLPHCDKSSSTQEASPLSHSSFSSASTSSSPSLLVNNLPPHALYQSQQLSSSSLSSSVSTALLCSARSTTTHDQNYLPESVRRSLTMERFANVCSEVLPQQLFIANQQVAHDPKALDHYGITHLVNCCCCCCDNDAPNGGLAQLHGRPVLQLRLRDNVQEDLLPFVWPCIEFIAAALASRPATASTTSSPSPLHKVLVFCHQGVSRSCAMAIAAIMCLQRLSFHQAASLVKQKRSLSSPNSAFICQLLEFEQELLLAADAIQGVVWFRLAPHAEHDPNTVVLKLCYESKDSRRRLVRMDVSKFHAKGCLVLFVVESNRWIIWKGLECVIPQADGLARSQIERIVRCHAMKCDPCRSPDSFQVQVAIQLELFSRESAEFHQLVDPFLDPTPTGSSQLTEYATELTWVPASPSSTSITAGASALALTTSSVCILEEDTSDSYLAQEQAISRANKPQLFALDILRREWESLGEYDSEDLVADGVLLLVSSISSDQTNITKAFVWKGHQNALTNEEILVLASKVTSKTTLGVDALRIVHGQQEPDDFWELFEAGY